MHIYNSTTEYSSHVNLPSLMHHMYAMFYEVIQVLTPFVIV